MRNIVLLTILALAFCFSEITLTYFLPLARTDFDVWLKYFFAKDGIYDAMFFLFSLLLLWNIKANKAKAICVFLVIVTGGSFLDKVVFKMNQYLLSDVALIVGGIFTSVYLYWKWEKKK